jgi:hypothetical protein
MKIKIVLKLFYIVGALLIVGFSRDFIFKSINALVKANDFDMDYYLHPSLSYLEQFENTTLIKIKWLLTLIFSLLYFIIDYISIKSLFKNQTYLKILFFTYVSVFLISGILILIGILLQGQRQAMYEFARYLMGMLQSPLILMILIPVFQLNEKSLLKN